MSIKQTLAQRIAQFAHEERCGEGSWLLLSEEERTKAADLAWAKVFKEDRVLHDPYFQLRDGTNAPLNREKYDLKRNFFYDLKDARTIARSLVGDELKLVNIVEVIEQGVTTFYQKVVKTVEEDA